MKKSFGLLKKKPPTDSLFTHIMISCATKGKYSQKKLGGVLPNMKKIFRGGVSRNILLVPFRGIHSSVAVTGRSQYNDF